MKKIKLSNFAAVALACLFAASCGTTSDLNPSPTSTSNVAASKYSKVIVKDFKLSESSIKQEMKYKAQIATREFKNLIISELTKTGSFKSVSSAGVPSADTLFISGVITQYDDGNAALRFMIGLGAGSSRFDSVVNFYGGKPPKSLGAIEVDKNSWVLGGALASAQTASSYMPGAAKKIAEEAVKLAK